MEPTKTFFNSNNCNRNSYITNKYDTTDCHIMDSLYKTKFCPRLSSKNECRYGDQCPFAHSASELRPLPDFRKTKLCTNFMEKNCCHAEKACSFAHGENELKQNIRRNFQFEKNTHISSTGSRHERTNSDNIKLRLNLPNLDKQGKLDELLDYFKIFCTCFMGDKLDSSSIKDMATVLKLLEEHKNAQSEMCGKSTAHSSESGGPESEFPIKNKKTRRGKRGGRNKNKESNKSKECLKNLAHTSSADNQDIRNTYNCLADETNNQNNFRPNNCRQTLPFKDCNLTWQLASQIRTGQLNKFGIQCNKECEVKLLESLGFDSHFNSNLIRDDDHKDFACTLDSNTHSDNSYIQNYSIWDDALLKLRNANFFSPNFDEKKPIIDLNSTSTRDVDYADDSYETSYNAINPEPITEHEIEDKRCAPSPFDYDTPKSHDCNFASRFMDPSMFMQNLNQSPLFEHKLNSGIPEYNLIKELMNMNLDH